MRNNAVPLSILIPVLAPDRSIIVGEENSSHFARIDVHDVGLMVIGGHFF